MKKSLQLAGLTLAGAMIGVGLMSVTSLATGRETVIRPPCYHGTFYTLAFGKLPGWHVIHEDLGPYFFRIHARGVQWPGGTLGYIHNDPAVCNEAEAAAYGAAHPDEGNP